MSQCESLPVILAKVLPFLQTVRADRKIGGFIQSHLSASGETTYTRTPQFYLASVNKRPFFCILQAALQSLEGQSRHDLPYTE